MKDHVIRSALVINKGSCRVLCYMEPNCVSMNFGPSHGGKYRCELNNATDEDHMTVLEEKPTFTFLAIEVTIFMPGTYVFDPDGKGGVPPYSVTCDTTVKNGVGVTVISHDSEIRTLVDGCEPSFCYKRFISYAGASLPQLAKLARVSSSCEQIIKYECRDSQLFKNSSNKVIGWWVSRDGNAMNYWGGASPGNGKQICTCRMNNSCVSAGLVCNCDKNDNEWRQPRSQGLFPILSVTGSTENNVCELEPRERFP